MTAAEYRVDLVRVATQLASSMGTTLTRLGSGPVDHDALTAGIADDALKIAAAIVDGADRRAAERYSESVDRDRDRDLRLMQEADAEVLARVDSLVAAKNAMSRTQLRHLFQGGVGKARAEASINRLLASGRLRFGKAWYIDRHGTPRPKDAILPGGTPDLVQPIAARSTTLLAE